MFLAGCASQQPPGSSGTNSQGNYNRDMYECEREHIQRAKSAFSKQ
jgi:hypothetical protein